VNQNKRILLIIFINSELKDVLSKRLVEIKQAGTWKHERVITSPQKHQIYSEGRQVLNFCANNYLGLADNPQVYKILFFLYNFYIFVKKKDCECSEKSFG